MRKLMNLLSGLFLVLVFLAAITFSYYNTTAIAIYFGNWQSVARPVSVWIIAAFVGGGFLGLILGSRLLSKRRGGVAHKQLEKELQNTKQEVRKLRALSLKDLD